MDAGTWYNYCGVEDSRKYYPSLFSNEVWLWVIITMTDVLDERSLVIGWPKRIKRCFQRSQM